MLVTLRVGDQRPALSRLRSALPLLNWGWSFAGTCTVACTRVAANSRDALPDREGTEPTEFDTVTPRQTISNRLEDGIDEALHLAVDEVRILHCQPHDEF